MFNQSGRNAYSPSNQPRRTPAQPTPSNYRNSNDFAAQIRPDFMKPSSPSSASGGLQPASRMQRIKPDNFQSMTPQSQRAALFDQARLQAAQINKATYQTQRTPSSALPGGLTEKQTREFQMLQRTDPMAAQAKLQQYQNNADIRYNKPGTAPPATGSGLTYKRPPTSFNGPRKSFGA